MNEILLWLFGGIAIIGSVYTGISRDPYRKLIAIGLLSGAIMPLLMDRGYVDIAIALALILPLSTVFILQLCRKGET
jgi:energy-converting hydrogenase A subunit D